MVTRFEVFITAGYLLLGRSRQADSIRLGREHLNEIFQPCQLQDWGVWAMVIFLCACNVGLFIFPCIPPYKNAYGQNSYINGYTYPVVTAGILVITAFYYLLCFANPWNWSLLRLVGLRSEIRPLCTGRRHPYFGYEYRVFITDLAFTRPEQTPGDPPPVHTLPAGVPVADPEVPVADPEVPEDDPKVPEGDPEVPEDDPEVPEGDPAVPEGGPTAPEGGPAAPEADPAVLIKVFDRPHYIALILTKILRVYQN